MDFTQATKEQTASANEAFAANKNLKKVFATSDNQVFSSFDNAFNHTKSLEDKSLAEIDRPADKEKEPKKETEPVKETEPKKETEPVKETEPKKETKGRSGKK